MNTILKLAVVVVIVAAGAIGFAFSGIYDVSASSPHSGPVQWLLSTTSHASIERSAADIEAPDLDDDALVLAGINDFNSMCISCHGAPGINPDAMGQGLNPHAPDLAESAAEMTPAELFWVTKNGIKMTGMPAWGATHDDDSIWPVVALMARLPELDGTAYQSLLAAAEGHGHHAEDASVGEHSHDESAESSSDAGHEHGESDDHGEVAQPEAATEAAEEHDHSTHEHNR